MSEETVKRLGLATYDDLRYLLELLNDMISFEKFIYAPTDDEREMLLRCWSWVHDKSTGRMFASLVEGVDYTTLDGGE